MNNQEKDQEIKDQATAAEEQEASVAEEAATSQEAEVEVEVVEENPTEGNNPSEGDTPQSLEDAMEVIARMQVELRDAKAKADEAQAQAMRLQADFVNFRKRQEKEATQTIRFANEDLLTKLLPILDNFDRTLDTIEKTDNLTAVKDGISMVAKSMRKQLNKVGLEPIESKGKTFDSEIHEAITTIPVEEEAQKGIVIDEVEKGYKLKDRVIRYSKVVVGE